MTIIGEAWIKIRGQTSGLGKEVESGVTKEIGPVADSEGRKHGSTFASAFGDGANAGMSKLKLATLAGGAAIAAGVGVAAVGLYKLGEDFRDVSNEIRVKTGATGEKLDALNQSFKNVATTGPQSFKEVGAVVGDLAQKLGLSGAPLENLSRQFLDLAHITKGDVNAQMDAAIQLFRNFGITADQQGPALDKLYRAAQASGIGFDQLSSAMVAAGPTLRQVGLDFDHSAALVAALSKAGVDASQVMPGLAKAAATAAKEHKDAATVFSDTFARIKGAKSDVDASSEALAVFGARAGPRMATLIREGKLSLDDMLSSIQGGKDTIAKATSDTADFGEKWGTLKNRILVGLAPLAAEVFDAVGKGMDYIGENAGPAVAAIGDLVDKFDDLFASVGGPIGAIQIAWGSLIDGFTYGSGTADSEVGGLAKTFAHIGEVVKGVVDFIKQEWETHSKDIEEILGKYVETFRSEFEAISAVISKVVEIVTVIWDRFGQTLLGKIRVAIDAIIEIVKGLLDFMKGIFDLITAVLTGKWGKAWDAVKEIMKGAWEVIHGALRLALDAISTAIEGAKALISAAWSAIWHALNTLLHDAWDGYLAAIKWEWGLIIGFFKGLPGEIAGVASTLWGGLVEGFKAALNLIIDLWDKLHIPSIKIGGWDTPFGTTPSWSSPEIPFPKIPHLAAGGIVTSPTMALIGEAGPEAVIPLSGAGGALDALLGSIPHGWSIADYVSNLVHATSISLQSASLLIADWVDRLGRSTGNALDEVSLDFDAAFADIVSHLGDVSAAVAGLDKSTGDALGSVSKSIGDLGQASTSAAGEISSAVQEIISAAQQVKAIPVPTSGGGGSMSSDNATVTGGGGTAEFFDFYNSQPENVQQYLWSVGHPGGDPFPGVHQAASGGIFPARSGGWMVNLGEAGRAEAVVPLPAHGLGGGSVTVEQHNEFHGLDSGEVADALREANDHLVDALTAELAAGFSPGSV